MKTLLLVEDDRVLGKTLRQRLELEGFGVIWLCSKAELDQFYTSQSPNALPQINLVIMDIGLPDCSGLDLARDIKLRFDIPVIFLSALTSAEYRLEGFELGAEDYIPKPFHLKELLLRIKRVLGSSVSPPKSRVGLDQSSMSVILPDGTKHFPAHRDFRLLELLILNSPTIYSREEILSKLWEAEAEQSGRTVDNAVMRLRQILRKGQSDFIRSVRGVGYQWLESEN